jgi:hypothetical protein
LKCRFSKKESDGMGQLSGLDFCDDTF